MRKPTPSEQKNAMQNGVCYQYGIDQLEIASKADYKQLKEGIDKLRHIRRNLALHVKVHDLEELKNKSGYEVKMKKYKELYKQGFKSIIRMTCPSPEFFDLLIEHEQILGAYKPWIIELSKDIISKSEKDVIFLTDRRIDTAYKTNTSEMFLFDALNPSKRNKNNPKKFRTEEELEEWKEEERKKLEESSEYIGQRTLYLGKDDFTFKIYARISKREGKPCVHLEWRILWSANYKRFMELGITKKNGSYVESLKNLTKFDIADKWEELTTKHIKHAEINKELVGKQLADCQGLPKTFKNMSHKYRGLKQLTDEEKRNVNFEYRFFEHVWEIESTSEFIQYWDKYRYQGKDSKKKDSALHYSRFLKDIVLM